MPKFVVVFAEISTKEPLQVCYTVSFCLNTSSGKVVAQSTIPIERHQRKIWAYRHRPTIERTRFFENKWFHLCLPTAVVEYLQTTGSVKHIVNLLTTHSRQKNDSKTQVSEQRSLEGSGGPPVGHPWIRLILKKQELNPSLLYKHYSRRFYRDVGFTLHYVIFVTVIGNDTCVTPYARSLFKRRVHDRAFPSESWYNKHRFLRKNIIHAYAS